MASRSSKPPAPGSSPPPSPGTSTDRPTRGRVVALTGAAAFLGRNLLGLLEEDPRIARIVAFDIKTPETAGPKTRVVSVDLTSPSSEQRLAEALVEEQVDTLVHLCFLSSPTHATAWAHELESIGTMHILNAARRVNLRKLVMWSQTILYGAHPTNPNFLTEKHPLRADSEEHYFADKMAAEREVNAFSVKSKGTIVTILRTAPLLGPTVHNYVTRYLSQRAAFTLLGFDPLWQFLHEVDALAAFKLAIDRDVPGTFNIVGDGVLPLSTVARMAGLSSVPVLHTLAGPLIGALWTVQAAATPPSFLRYLRYICVADGTKAAQTMGFRPMYSTREALSDYIGAQRLRDAQLLSDPPA
ncbi:NAD-dependent epimerase/dehydratase family protein [Chondromyces apiculatus]|uniref:NAD dependent epimerase/dehydratase family n=1 Tax=Chondromyces apiculatus DSM 436 TaxID=1192034 RepID=A0A017T4E1_9BACT|nr:NAD-dependent epimerase/dehydratase family protein [Chondromyces apiculatus]EYF03680.1 NAD dependent epimerase/dehydratase family [Chondromyces apiculatus DSM 436]